MLLQGIFPPITTTFYPDGNDGRSNSAVGSGAANFAAAATPSRERR